ncbi:MAG: hypothetical protein V2J62_13200 [candidate division KSB1 bacterium]|jgi:hypothetical protein|nr:hypothetical protein [candidate division KSB1 bacterium]
MGKALLIIVLGFTTIMSTVTLSVNRRSLESVENFSEHYKISLARNIATSGINMALAKITEDSTWRSGYYNLSVSEADFDVVVKDHNTVPSMSSMELRLESTATFDDITKTIDVLLGIPPDIADLAVFCTDTIENVTIYDENKVEDPSLAIQNAPDMLPFDKQGLTNLATAQGHVHIGDYSLPNNYPNGDFYFDAGNGIPNVTHVTGDLTIGGGTNGFGIYVVEGNAVLDGNARLDGVLYLPNPGSIIINGGGDPKESNITGGVFANGYMNGMGNHISVEYEPDYMEKFGAFQLAKKMYIISWSETPDSLR